MAVKRKTGTVQSPSESVEHDVKDSCSNMVETEVKSMVKSARHNSELDNLGKSSDNEEEDTVGDKLPTVEDDLPLGSEANSLVSGIFGSKFGSLIDKRLGMLKSPHVGVSFESNNTSSSSINSVDMLLHERKEDPEQVLMNLGFGSTLHHDIGTCNTVGRIPERFLLNQSKARGIALEEFLEDNPELKTYVGTLKKKGSRSGAWKAARSMSSVLHHLKLATGPTSKHKVLPTVPQETFPESILIPENQRALAAQGFYENNCGVRTKVKKVHDTGLPKLTEETLKQHTQSQKEANPVHDAASRRMMFQKTHSKKWSTVQESVSQNVPQKSSSFDYTQSLDDYSQSIDFSTSNSMDSSDSPFSPDIQTSSASDLPKQSDTEATKQIEDDYFPLNSNSHDLLGLSDLNKKRGDKLGVDEDDSPPMSKQSTIERVKTLSASSAVGTDQVHIVVSADAENVFASGSNDQTDLSENRKNAFDNMNFLSIGSASGSDRLSDTESSSDHTVVDKLSSLDSPDVTEHQHNVHNFDTNLKSNEVKDSDKELNSPDENENFPLFKFIRQSPVIQESPVSRSSCAHGDELSRMGSVQSDSSGFGDADNSVDVTPHEGEIARLSTPGSLGSSSESAATLASNVSSILAKELLEQEKSTQSSIEHRVEIGVPVFSWQKLEPSDDMDQGTLLPLLTSYRKKDSKTGTYISTCYIPVAGKTKYTKFINKTTENRPDFKRSDNPVSITVTSASVERHEEKTCETRTSLRTNRIFGVPMKEPLYPGYASSNSSPKTSDSYNYSSTPEIPYWLKASSRRAQFGKSRFDFGSGDSILSGSEFSYCSTPDSISSSCNSNEMMDYSKLIKLINQPINIHGYKRSIIQYKPTQHVTEWSNFLRKKRLQEETSLLQYAIQKYKTELHSLETAFIIQFQQAYEELTDEERDEVEELQHLWTAIHQQLLETERLLSQRLKKISNGNDFFTFISSLSVLQKMILLLREQLYQQQVTVGKEELDQSPTIPFRSQSSSCLDVPVYSPINHGIQSRVGHSLDELRDSIIKDVREEMRRSTQHLHLDMQSKDNEIKRLQLELLFEKHGKGISLQRKPVQETDV